MTIGINASHLSSREPSGVEVVAKQLIQGVVHEALKRGDNVILYVPDTGILNPLFEIPGVTLKKLGWPFGSLWSQFRLGWELASNPPDVFVDASHFIPLVGIWSRCKKVFFLHDVSFRTFPNAYSKTNLLVLRFGTWLSARNADAVMVPSRYTRELVSAYYPFAAGKMYLAQPSPRKEFLAALSRASSPESINVRMPYALFVGRIDPKKNIENLILGFDQWNKREQYRFQLVLSGKGNGYRDSMELLTRTRNLRNITFTGFVSEQELANLFSHAAFVVEPSFGEGVGLPIIEGLAAGKNVLVCTETGGAARQFKEFLVECDSTIDGIASGLAQVANRKPQGPVAEAKGTDMMGTRAYEVIAMIVSSSLVHE